MKRNIQTFNLKIQTDLIPFKWNEMEEQPKPQKHIRKAIKADEEK